MHPKDLFIHNFTYTLPEEKIATYPLAERDASKLLVYQQGKIIDETFNKLSNYIPKNSLLLFNNSKVVAARLIFQKLTGANIEIFCLEPDTQYTDISTALSQKKKVSWQCLIGGASKWKKDQLLEKKIKINSKKILLKAAYKEKINNAFVIDFSWDDNEISFAEILQYAGCTALPPYIKRSPEEMDSIRYQTIYAKQDGSVAAPTAGLHFTDAVLNQLNQKNIQTDFVTLHVGAGTFKPVKAERINDHIMHAEYIDVSKTCIKNILNNLDQKIIAVGTTSLRTIESLYWLGVKKWGVLSQDSGVGSESSLSLSQWEAYELEEKNISVKEALQSLLNWMDSYKMERLIAKTSILIAPGYRFKIVNGLITNFHQPQSTLLLLIAAFLNNGRPQAEKNWEKVYEYALQNDYRFLSYGDASLLWHEEP